MDASGGFIMRDDDSEVDPDAIEDAVARGVEQGVVNVVSTAAEIYVLGGCFLMFVKAAFFLVCGVLLFGYILLQKH
jgi:hypothetical protein